MQWSKVFAVVHVVSCLVYAYYVLGFGRFYTCAALAVSILMASLAWTVNYRTSIQESWPVPDDVWKSRGYYVRFTLSSVSHTISGLGVKPDVVVLAQDEFELAGPMIGGIIDHEEGHLVLKHTYVVLLCYALSLRGLADLVTLYPLRFLQKRYEKITNGMIHFGLLGLSAGLCCVSVVIGWGTLGYVGLWYIILVYTESITYYFQEFEADEYAAKKNEYNGNRLIGFFQACIKNGRRRYVFRDRDMGFPVDVHPSLARRIKRMKKYEKSPQL